MRLGLCICNCIRFQNPLTQYRENKVILKGVCYGKEVGFKLHKVKKNWVTIGVSTLSMVALAGGALLADQSAQADEVSLPNGDGFEQTDAGIESSASLINEVIRQP